MRRGGSVRICASVINAQIVTFMTMNPQNSLGKRLILIWSMIEKWRCLRKWTLSLSSFQTFDFNMYFLTL